MASKFLKFTEVATLSTTKKYSVRSKQDDMLLGEIKWFGTWKRYCFYPSANTVFDIKCLSDIHAFVAKLK